MAASASIQETPFVKQLASSDRPTREKAVTSLQVFLASDRTLTNLELLKTWKGLFFYYLKIIEDMLVEIEGRVSDGLRYHILDVWVDELGKVDEERKAPLAEILTIVVKAKETGRTKILKARAQEVLDDERLSTWATVKQESAASKA
ncbi:MAG: hypothetical protein LQ340_007560 [Diploschistes diacapsis]|nr:MAG: hypothetical protein LQ340_007560 [Diploschistes diacapsis]